MLLAYIWCFWWTDLSDNFQSHRKNDLRFVRHFCSPKLRLRTQPWKNWNVTWFDCYSCLIWRIKSMQKKSINSAINVKTIILCKRNSSVCVETIEHNHLNIKLSTNCELVFIQSWRYLICNQSQWDTLYIEQSVLGKIIF